MFYPLYSTKKLIVPNLTTKGVISKLPDKLFCYAKQRNMLFIVHNPEARNFIFFQLGLKYSHSLNTWHILLETNVMGNNPSAKLMESDLNGFCSM